MLHRLHRVFENARDAIFRIALPSVRIVLRVPWLLVAFTCGFLGITPTLLTVVSRIVRFVVALRIVIHGAVQPLTDAHSGCTRGVFHHITRIRFKTPIIPGTSISHCVAHHPNKLKLPDVAMLMLEDHESTDRHASHAPRQKMPLSW